MRLLASTLLAISLFAGQASAQETDGPAGPSAKAQANNPLADFRAFNVHNYYIPEYSGNIDSSGNSMILRYAQPFGKWLMRASLPFKRKSKLCKWTALQSSLSSERSAGSCSRGLLTRNGQ